MPNDVTYHRPLPAVAPKPREQANLTSGPALSVGKMEGHAPRSDASNQINMSRIGY